VIARLAPAFTRLAQSPPRFALVVVLVYAALLIPTLARHGFDASYFIVAGDRYVAAAPTAAPINIRPHSDGYDGQFYYRLALAPLSTAARVGGVAFDHPAWRMQRILVPALVHVLALGIPAAVPWVFIGLNLAGVFAIAWLAAMLARQFSLPWVAPVAIAFWPGWQIALVHDTTEIGAAALLFAALTAYLRERMAAYALLLALATLARETAILAGIGIAVIEAWRLLRAPAPRRWGRAICAALALLPFLIWRQLVAARWQGGAQAHGIAHNAGWPLLGWLQATAANILNHAVGAAPAPHGRIMRLTILAGIVTVVSVAVPALRAAGRGLSGDQQAGIALGWLLMLLLMAVLTANGPLIDATAFFRALSEFWVISWVVLASSRPDGITRIRGLVPWVLLVGFVGSVQLR
jgi:hypothetical protein